MNETERSLRVLHLLTEQALADAGSVVANALLLHTLASQRLRDSIEEQQRTEQELQRLARSTAINATTYDMVRQMLDVVRRRVDEMRMAFSHATRTLNEACEELGRCRQREAELSRVLKHEQRHARRQQRQAEGNVLDELWLQSTGART